MALVHRSQNPPVLGTLGVRRPLPAPALRSVDSDGLCSIAFRQVARPSERDGEPLSQAPWNCGSGNRSGISIESVNRGGLLPKERNRLRGCEVASKVESCCVMAFGGIFESKSAGTGTRCHSRRCGASFDWLEALFSRRRPRCSSSVSPASFPIYRSIAAFP